VKHETFLFPTSQICAKWWMKKLFSTSSSLTFNGSLRASSLPFPTRTSRHGTRPRGSSSRQPSPSQCSSQGLFFPPCFSFHREFDLFCPSQVRRSTSPSFSVWDFVFPRPLIGPKCANSYRTRPPSKLLTPKRFFICFDFAVPHTLPREPSPPT